MKIIRIFLKNLNSLQGDFDINLENEPFASSGIFAITGPTGAGKSTILDAITLALYGRAARYGNDKPENMMSRGTGECQADVIFEVPKGRYRASWSLQRAHRRANGKLQQAQRHVSDSNGTVIAQKSSEVDKIIEELTGLDADRFFRSVLLAQGDFVKFLKATPDERATLLESLTGTGIYTEISKKVHQETSLRAHALALRENRLENIPRLNEENRSALKNKICELKNEIESNSQHLFKLNDLISKGSQLTKFLNQNSALKSQLESINKQNSLQENDFKRLKLYREGATYFTDLQTLDQIFKNLNEEKMNLDRAEKNHQLMKHQLRAGHDATEELILKNIEDLEKAILNSSLERTQKTEKLNSLNEWLEVHREHQFIEHNMSTIVEQITLLTTHRINLKSIEKSTTVLLKDQELHQQNLKVLQSEKNDILTLLKEKNSQLDSSKKELFNILQGKLPENLQQEMLSLDERLISLRKVLETLAALDKNNISLNALKKTVEEFKLKVTEVKKTIAVEENFLNTQVEKIKQLKDEFDKNRLIASLHVHRENLEPGAPCPLCGSLEHPFTESIEIHIPKISALETEISCLHSLVAKKEKDLKNLIKTGGIFEEALRINSENLKTTSDNEELLKANLNSLIKMHTLCLESNDENFKIISKEFASCESQLLQVRSRLKASQECALKIKDLQDSLVTIQHEAALKQNKISSQEEKIQAILIQLETLKIGLNHSQSVLSNLEASLENYLKAYGLAPPLDGEEKKLQATLESLKIIYQDNLKLSNDIKTKLAFLSLSTKDLESKSTNLRAQLEKLILVHDIAAIESSSTKKNEFLALWNTIEDAQTGLTRLNTDLKLAENHFVESQNKVLKIHNTYLETESKLSHDLIGTHFKSIENLRASHLSPSDAHRIQKSEEEINRQLDICQGQLAQVEIELKGLSNVDIPQGEKLIEIQNAHKEMHIQTNSLGGLLAVSESDLQKDLKNHLEYEALSKELESERLRLSFWQKLSNLIGSHDGKAFRKFAQGLSLDLLINHANGHLSSLNNRYRLKRMPGDELDLEILDLHQANATRPTASLSGGESFLTSLALALGLSDLAGKNVKIDSLFIDEGFGSLDSEALRRLFNL